MAKDGDGARWHLDSTRVYLQGVGQVKVGAHREVRGRVKTIQIRREGRRWLLVLSCDEVPTNPLPGTGHQAGVEVGIASFATTSDGAHILIVVEDLAIANMLRRPKPVTDAGARGRHLPNGAAAKTGAQQEYQ
jgi:hypothetical protein